MIGTGTGTGKVISKQAKMEQISRSTSLTLRE